jgi:hypothetical protein
LGGIGSLFGPTAIVKRDIDVVKTLTCRPQLLLAKADEVIE